MSKAAGTSRSVREKLTDGGLSVPSAEVSTSPDGERVRLEWWPGQNVRARALFRVATDDRLAILTDLAAWRIAQKGVTGSLDWDTGLDRIPDGLLLVLEGEGYTPAEEGHDE